MQDGELPMVYGMKSLSKVSAKKSYNYIYIVTTGSASRPVTVSQLLVAVQLTMIWLVYSISC